MKVKQNFLIRITFTAFFVTLYSSGCTSTPTHIAPLYPASATIPDLVMTERSIVQSIWSPDQQKIAALVMIPGVLGFGPRLEVYDLKTLQRLYFLKDQTTVERVERAEFSPNGDFLLTAALGGTKVWSAQTGQKLFDVGPTNTPSYDASAIFLDNSWVATLRDGNKDASTRILSVWDIRSGLQVLPAQFFPSGMYELTLSADNKHFFVTEVAGCCSDIANITDAETGRVLFQKDFSDQKKKFLGTNYENDVKITFSISPNARYLLAFLHIRNLNSGKIQDVIQVWDPASSSMKYEKAWLHGIDRIEFTKDEEHFVVLGRSDSTGTIFDTVETSTGQITQSVVLPGSEGAPILCGTKILVGPPLAYPILYDLSSGLPQVELDTLSSALGKDTRYSFRSPSCSPDTKQLLLWSEKNYPDDRNLPIALIWDLSKL